jgi:starch phosphorylase
MAQQWHTPQTADATLRETGRDTVLTLHTPVPAGNERYDLDLAAEMLTGPAAAIGLDPSALMELGRRPEGENGSSFDLTAFGLRLAGRVNAVSRRHGEIATAIWQPVIGRVIPSVTNGVHLATWQADPMRTVIGKRVGEGLSDADLWTAHAEAKRKMIEFLGSRLTRQAVRHGVAPESVGDLAGALDPDALTIGFARRFATYKRADLILADPHRLTHLLSDPDRPVQLIFAGKAHPADDPGRAMLGRVVAACRRIGLAGRLFFIEDYDLRIARFLVAGVDLWLNTPRRPLEASGTSGMKAALNGVPSLSILDGWWAEGHDGTNGWAIGGPMGGDAPEVDDAADAVALYHTLETEVVPAFFERDADGLPRRWIGFMRGALTVASSRFTTDRVLDEYLDRLYRPLSATARPEAAESGAGRG